MSLAVKTIKLSSVYDNCKNKNQLSLAIWEQHNGSITPREVVEIACQARPDIGGFILSDAYNGQTNWRRKHGIAPATKAKKTPATAKPASVASSTSVYDVAFDFVVKSNGIDNAIAILEQLRKLKNVL